MDQPAQNITNGEPAVISTTHTPSSTSSSVPSFGVSTGRHTLSSSCSTMQSFDDELEDFAEVMKLVEPSALLDIATAARGGQIPAISVEERPECGSFNLVYTIHFEDNSKWVARVPQFATPAHFHAAQAQNMSAELELQRLIRSKTTIPVPEIFHYDTTFNNPFGVPFCLESWLDGCSVGALWDKTDGPTPRKERQLRMLESIASAMAQLNFFSHSEIGVPKVDPAQSIATGTEKLRGRDVDKEIEYFLTGWPEDAEDKQFAFLEEGPFNNTADYLRSMLYTRKLPWEREKGGVQQRENGDLQGLKRLMEIVIDAIESIEKQEDSHKEASGEGSCQFVIRHPDFALQNVLIAEDGSLMGLLDWDGVQTVPKTFGFASYPDWIIRDWEPSSYHYGEEGEDSVSELRELREAYRGYVSAHLEEDNKTTRNCHLYQVVERACRQKNYIVPITTKLGRVCLGGHLFDVKFQYKGNTYTAGPNKNWLDNDPVDDESDEEDSSECEDSDVEEEDQSIGECDDELTDEVTITQEVLDNKVSIPPLAGLLIKSLILTVFTCSWLALLYASSALFLGGWLHRMFMKFLFPKFDVQAEAHENPWASPRRIWDIVCAPYNLIVTSGASTERIQGPLERSNPRENVDENHQPQIQDSVKYVLAEKGIDCVDLEHYLQDSVKFALTEMGLDCLHLKTSLCACLTVGGNGQTSKAKTKLQKEDKIRGDDGSEDSIDDVVEENEEYEEEDSDDNQEEEEEDEEGIVDDEEEEEDEGNNDDDDDDDSMDESEKDEEDDKDKDDDDTISEVSYKPDPNQETPDWLWELLMALGQGTVSPENIEKLKSRFIEKFSSEEVVEEWALS